MKLQQKLQRYYNEIVVNIKFATNLAHSMSFNCLDLATDVKSVATPPKKYFHCKSIVFLQSIANVNIIATRFFCKKIVLLQIRC